MSIDLLYLYKSAGTDPRRVYISLMQCRKTGWVELAVLFSKKAHLVFSSFMNHWATSKGLPKFVRADNGTEFSELKSWAARNSIQWNETSPYTPQQNAHNERSHGVLLHIIRTAVRDTGLNLNNLMGVKLLIEGWVRSIYNHLPTAGNLVHGKPTSPAKLVGGDSWFPRSELHPGTKIFYQLPKRAHKLGDNYATGTFYL